MTCPNCQYENPKGIKFCGACGTPLQAVCQACGAENPPEYKFCGHCGSQISKDTSPHRDLQVRKEAEKKHLTVMFCDLVGSTALSSQLDPEELRSVITTYQNVCEKVVSRYEGYIAQYLGDGVLVYFGYPRAHENAAHRALSTGLGIIEAVRHCNTQLKESDLPGISVRIGIHTGHVVVGDMGGSGQGQHLALGVTPNIAARLEGLAEPNEVIISEDTYHLTQNYFLCDHKGEYQLKGLPQPLRVYKVVQENTAKSRFEQNINGCQTPIVGRTQEISKLKEFWNDAKIGKSNIVLLSGEPGVGKSRILQDLMTYVAEDTGAWLSMHYCSAYHQQTAFYPLADTIKNVVLELTDDLAAEEKISRLEGFLLEYGFHLEEMVPLFANILSLPLGKTSYRPTPFSMEQQQQKLIAAFIQMCLERSSQQNLLLVFEDIQWMDPSTLDFIKQLINQPPTSHILVILSFRTEFTPPWHMQPHIHHMVLSNLSADSVSEIIKKIAGNKPLPPQIVEQIIHKTDGIPLFVEELTKMVLVSGMLAERKDRYELSGSTSSLSIPSTLYDSLVARLDRMAHAGEVAQLGATIGREFSYDLINILSELDETELTKCLNKLVEAELLVQRGVPPYATYKFRHALIRDVAYQSLLKSKQQTFHRLIAQTIIKKVSVIAENSPEVVAHHLEKSQMFPEAITYWTYAADKIRQHLAYNETLNFIERGLSLIKKVENEMDRPVYELKLLIIQASVLIKTEGLNSERAYQASCRMRELAEQLNDDMSLFEALRGIITYKLFTGRVNNALQLAEKALSIAKSLKTNEVLIEAYRLIGRTFMYAGKLSLSRDSFNRSISLYRSDVNSFQEKDVELDPEIFSLIQSSHVLWYLGYPDKAVARTQEAVEKADILQRPYTQVLCTFLSSHVSLCCGHLQEALSYAKSCIASCEAYGIVMFRIEARVLLGAVMARTGEVDAGITMMWDAIKLRLENRLISAIHLHMSTFAAVCLEVGRIETGLKAVNESISFTKKSDDKLLLSEVYRLKGELLFAQPGQAREKVMGCLQKSLEIAQKQNAKSLELRTVLSMSKVLESQGKYASALKLVSNVYNWFQEGFETHDLKEAQQLIERLSVTPYTMVQNSN